ncbi:MAG: hypothetical protein IJ094_11750 [Bacilli bacterium]|nr:hypothetical protein [Bacilli bacterium]
MHPIIFVKVYKKLDWYFENIDLFNGITDGKYSFKQLTPKKLHFKVFKSNETFGKFATFKNLNITVGNLDTEKILDIFNQFIIHDKIVLINLISNLSNREIRLLDRLTEKYSKFYGEIPTLVV